MLGEALEYFDKAVHFEPNRKKRGATGH